MKNLYRRENNYYLDFLYVHKDHQRQGIADKLYSEIEKEAIKRGETVLHSDVSETARNIFLKKGFKTIAPQTKIINGVEIKNYKMAKQINDTGQNEQRFLEKLKLEEIFKKAC